jgi:hypothetical protein
MTQPNNITDTIVSRIDQIQRASQALLFYDLDEQRIENAQRDLDFDEGIKVANDVMAEFIADLGHLCDYHGQDFPAILDAAALKYAGH